MDDPFAFLPVVSFLVNIGKPFMYSVQSENVSSQFRNAPAISKKEFFKSFGATLEIAVKKINELKASASSSSFKISFFTAVSNGIVSHPCSVLIATLVKRIISFTNPNLTPPAPSQLPALVAIDFKAG